VQSQTLGVKETALERADGVHNPFAEPLKMPYWVPILSKKGQYFEEKRQFEK
jgi:hypothetical protein